MGRFLQLKHRSCLRDIINMWLWSIMQTQVHRLDGSCERIWRTSGLPTSYTCDHGRADGPRVSIQNHLMSAKYGKTFTGLQWESKVLQIVILKLLHICYYRYSSGTKTQL